MEKNTFFLGKKYFFGGEKIFLACRKKPLWSKEKLNLLESNVLLLDVLWSCVITRSHNVFSCKFCYLYWASSRSACYFGRLHRSCHFWVFWVGFRDTTCKRGKVVIIKKVKITECRVGFICISGLVLTL